MTLRHHPHQPELDLQPAVPTPAPPPPLLVPATSTPATAGCTPPWADVLTPTGRIRPGGWPQLIDWAKAHIEQHPDCDECWLAPRTSTTIRVAGSHPHRIGAGVLLLAQGLTEPPDGQVARHACGSRRPVAPYNPCWQLNHLEWGSPADNMADKVADGNHRLMHTIGWTSIIDMHGAGVSGAEIARRLGVSVYTVKNAIERTALGFGKNQHARPAPPEVKAAAIADPRPSAVVAREIGYHPITVAGWRRKAAR